MLQSLHEIVQQLRWEGLMGVNLFQPPGSSAPSAGDNRVDVPRAKLSRLSLLRGTG
jgi:hypothetical protein